MSKKSNTFLRGYDVTEGFNLSDGMEHATEDFRLVFHRSHLGMMILDTEGNPLRINPVLLKMLGYSEDELRAINVVDLTHPEDRELTKRLLSEVGAGERDNYEIDKRYRRKDGSFVWVSAALSAVSTSSGVVDHYLATIEDLTMLRRSLKAQRNAAQYQAQLIQSQKLESVAHLAGSVAHDFNNILTAMGLHLELLGEEPDLSPEKIRAGLETLKHAVSRASSLTRQLLLFSRREAATREQTDIHALITNVTRLMDRLLGENIRLINTPPLESCEAVVDPGMIEQVLSNLTLNARDAITTAGLITIEARNIQIFSGGVQAVSKNPAARPGRYIAIVVEDTGCGMTPETMSRIFDPFFTTKPQGRGTGLGLPTVLGIVEQHDGWIDVESQVGQGTTFKVFLPAFSGPAAPGGAGPASDEAKGGKESILLVEDETTVRTVAALALRRWGYKVHVANNGDQAIDMLGGGGNPKIDLLLSDIRMPGRTDGHALAAWFIRKFPDIPVILMSGYERAAAGQDGKVPSEDEHIYLKKPFETKVLLAAVRTAFGTRTMKRGG